MKTISIAGIPIGIEPRFVYLDSILKDYLTSEPPAFSVAATDEELREEAARYDTAFSDAYLESAVVYRKIGEILPRYDAFVFHGAVIAEGDSAYAVTAKSGTGKTTHLNLWLRVFGDAVHILNGDKPIFRLIDGVPYACGTPWMGKENYGRNEMLPLRGLAFLHRGKENRILPVSPEAGVLEFFPQVYLPHDPSAMRLTVPLVNRYLSSVPLFRLECNMEPEAAIVAHRAFTNKT